jgi:hypothetical protein
MKVPSPLEDGLLFGVKEALTTLEKELLIYLQNVEHYNLQELLGIKNGFAPQYRTSRKNRRKEVLGYGKMHSNKNSFYY